MQSYKKLAVLLIRLFAMMIVWHQIITLINVMFVANGVSVLRPIAIYSVAAVILWFLADRLAEVASKGLD